MAVCLLDESVPPPHRRILARSFQPNNPATALSIASSDSSSANRCSKPTWMSEPGGSWLFLTSSSESGKARLVSPAVRDHAAGLHCRSRAPSLRRTEEQQRRGSAVDVHRYCAATTRTDHNVGTMLVELGLGNAGGGVEVVVRQGRVQNLVAVTGEVVPPGATHLNTSPPVIGSR